MKGKAFCPAHVTGFFKAELGGRDGAEEAGSIGAGFSIQDGVTTTVTVRDANAAGFDVRVSGYSPENVEVSGFVVRRFLEMTDRPVHVDILHEVSVPIGYGLGCSGAVALSLSLALNEALKTGLSRQDAGRLAHAAEVECKTGLGDVLAAYHGGFEIRTRPGAPGTGSLKKIDSDYTALIICFAPVSTKGFIEGRLESINGLGGKMVGRLSASHSYDDFQDMSLEFARYVKMMTPRMAEVIDELHGAGFRCGVALFGQTVFTLVRKGSEEEAMRILSRYRDGIIIRSGIDNLGARVQ